MLDFRIDLIARSTTFWLRSKMVDETWIRTASRALTQASPPQCMSRGRRGGAVDVGSDAPSHLEAKRRLAHQADGHVRHVPDGVEAHAHLRSDGARRTCARRLGRIIIN